MIYFSIREKKQHEFIFLRPENLEMLFTIGIKNEGFSTSEGIVAGFFISKPPHLTQHRTTTTTLMFTIFFDRAGKKYAFPQIQSQCEEGKFRGK